jgi:hypothetical protein
VESERSLAELVGQVRHLRARASLLVTSAAAGDIGLALRLVMPPPTPHARAWCLAVVVLTGTCIVLARRIVRNIRLLQARIRVLLGQRPSGQNA